jgi:methionine-rich copper-binding protein CopC
MPLTTDSHRRLRRIVMSAAAVLLGALVTLAPVPAWAHAGLESSSPAAGQRLDALPSEVSFTFSEDLATPAYVVVTAPDGTSLTSGDPVVEGTTLKQAVSAGPPGDYSMAYRAISSDGHPVTGEISFTVGAASTPPTTAPTAARPASADSDGFWSGDGIRVAVGVGLVVVGCVLLLLRSRRSA